MQNGTVVEALKRLRLEWQEAAGSVSLVDTHGSVGLLLEDVALGSGLSEAEIREALGLCISGTGRKEDDIRSVV